VFTVANWKRKMLASAAMVGFVASIVGAQTNVDEGKRKAKFKSAVPYPELARRMKVAGKVKIEVLIAADGHVKSARAVGGHPVLVQSCLDSVKDWKFDSATEETTQIIEFNFTE
jgi:TonB family protein